MWPNGRPQKSWCVWISRATSMWVDIWQHKPRNIIFGKVRSANDRRHLPCDISCRQLHQTSPVRIGHVSTDNISCGPYKSFSSHRVSILVFPSLAHHVQPTYLHCSYPKYCSADVGRGLPASFMGCASDLVVIGHRLRTSPLHYKKWSSDIRSCMPQWTFTYTSIQRSLHVLMNRFPLKA